MKLEFSRHIFENYSNIKFHENPSSGSRVIPCGRTDGRPDMTEPIVSFRNFCLSAEKYVPNVILGPFERKNIDLVTQLVVINPYPANVENMVSC